MDSDSVSLKINILLERKLIKVCYGLLLQNITLTM